MSDTEDPTGQLQKSKLLAEATKLYAEASKAEEQAKEIRHKIAQGWIKILIGTAGAALAIGKLMELFVE